MDVINSQQNQITLPSMNITNISHPGYGMVGLHRVQTSIIKIPLHCHKISSHMQGLCVLGWCKVAPPIRNQVQPFTWEI